MTFPNGGQRDENHPNRRVEREMFGQGGQDGDALYSQARSSLSMRRTVDAKYGTTADPDED